MLGRGYQEPLRGQRPPNHLVGVSSKDSRPRVQGWVVVLGLLPPGPFWSSLEKLGGGVLCGAHPGPSWGLSYRCSEREAIQKVNTQKTS